MPPAQVMGLLISWLIMSAKYRSALTSFTSATSSQYPNYFRDQTEISLKRRMSKTYLRSDVKRNHNWNIPFFDNCRVLKITILIAIFSLTKGFIWILLRWHCLSWGPWGQRSCEHWARWPGVTSPRLSGKLQSRIDDSGSWDGINWNRWPPSFLNLNVPLIVFSYSHDDEHNCCHWWVFLVAQNRWTEQSWWFRRISA